MAEENALVPIHVLCAGIEPLILTELLTISNQFILSLDICSTISDVEKKLQSNHYDFHFFSAGFLEKNSQSAIFQMANEKPFFIIAENQEEIDAFSEKWGNTFSYQIVNKQVTTAKIKTLFQEFTKKKTVSDIIIPKSEGVGPFVYIVDPDVTFLKSLEQIREQYYMRVELEPDPQKALENLKKNDFNPNALIVGQLNLTTSFSPFELFTIALNKKEMQKSIFGLILEQDNMDLRIEATQKGVHHVFHKPIYPNVLLNTMREALQLEVVTQFKALILDDDPDFCNFVTVVLSEIGIIVKAIYNADELIHTLDEFKPQILLLDLVLPKYDGLNILKSLRQEAKYNSLIIVIVTSQDENVTRLKAYSAKADEILYKPLNLDVLQKRILGLAERHEDWGSQQISQEFAKPVYLRTLLEKIENCLKGSNKNNFSMALFEVDNFGEWAKRQGYTAANDLLFSIQSHLESVKDPKMQYFSYNIAKFAIVFEEDWHAAELKVTKLIPASENTHFNCSLIPITKSLGSASEILQVAEHLLNEAREKPQNLLRIATLPEKITIPLTKEVVVIDPDEQLLKILKTSFEAHGVVVHTYREGGNALNDIIAAGESHLPLLMIIERKLPDMDGLDVITKLHSQFHTIVPFYVLSLYASDKDVSEGLKKGALEYIVKPFNLSLLMQKALKTIFVTSQ